MKKVFIVGSSGTTGLRLKARLSRRDDVRLLEISDERRKDTDEIKRLIELSDFCFLCLPDAAAQETAELAKGCAARLIDASTAHRTSAGWTYGFPELSDKHRQAIKSARLVAVPGCHAGGVIALIYPLVQAGVIGVNYPLCCTSLTGYSGGGKSMIAGYEGKPLTSERKSPMQYAMAQNHKHLPEIISQCGLITAPVFMPVVGDFYSGMLVTIPLHTSLLKKSHTVSSIRELLREHYAGSSFVKVMDEEPASLYAGSLAGRDDMELYVSGNDERILLCAHFDNLGKGASGAAIQCFNIMSGVDEQTGLLIG